MNHPFFRWMSLVALLIFFISCSGAPPQQPPNSTVGPNGGTVTSTDGRVKLVFPAGAVEAETTVTITPITNPTDPDAIPGTAYDFGPDGSFAKPVALTIAYDPANLPAGTAETDLMIAKLHSDGSREFSASTVDETANTVTGSITSFSNRMVCGCGGAPGASAPTLTSEYNQNRTITLTWTPVQGITLYRIERAVKTGGTTIPTVTDSDFTVYKNDHADTTYTDQNIGPNAAFYFYRVRWWQSSGGTMNLGPPSNVERVTVFGAASPPAVPTDFRASAAGGSAVSLFWDASPTADSYILERRTGSNPYTQIATLPGTDQFHTDTGLDPLTTYDYRLKAKNDAGESGYATASATTLEGCSDFDLSVGLRIVSVVEGVTARIPITITRAAHFTDPIDLFLEGDRSSLEGYSFHPPRVLGSSSEIELTVKEGGGERIESFTILGESTQNFDVQCRTALNLYVWPASDNYTLYVSTNGNGTVYSEPAGIYCFGYTQPDSDCREDFPSGTTVYLYAQPNAPDTFLGWEYCGEGNAGADGSICTITMDRNRSVFADFSSSPQPPPGN